MYEKFLVLESAKVNFNPQAILLMNIAIALIMAGVALGIKIDNFKDLFKSPKPFVVGIASQFLVLPFISFLLVVLLPIPVSVGLGMLLVAACPGGNVSNFMSSYSRANVELSVSLTMFSTLASWILTPINFALYGNWYLHIAARKHEILPSVDIDFIQLLKTITLILIIPLIIGLLIAKYYPKIADKAGPYIRKISMTVFIVIIVLALKRNVEQIFAYLHIVFVLVFIHSLLAYGSGYVLGKSFKLSQKNVRTIMLETGIQNAGLALALVLNPKLFNGAGGMAAVTAWWGVWSIVGGAIVASYFSYKKIKE